MEKLRLHPMDSMTPWERKRAYESGRDVDRSITIPFMSELKCTLTGNKIYDWWHNPNVMADVEIKMFNKFGYDRLTLGPNTRGITEALGGEFIYPENQVPHMKGVFLKDYNSLNSIDPTLIGEHDRIKVFLEALAVRPIEKVLRDTRKNPEMLH